MSGLGEPSGWSAVTPPPPRDTLKAVTPFELGLRIRRVAAAPEDGLFRLGFGCVYSIGVGGLECRVR